jgi:hypothetical protein
MLKFLTPALLISSFCFGQTESKKASTDWKTLDGPDYSVQYPFQWELSQNGQMGTSFVLFAPQESNEDLFKENVNLLIQDLTGYDLDLDKYTDLTLDQIKTMITNSSLIESKRLKKGLEEYQHLIYTGDQSVFNLQFEQYFWVKNNKAFILTFTSEQTKSAAYKEIGEKILNSFTFKK